jgi:hypothetical protein
MIWLFLLIELQSRSVVFFLFLVGKKLDRLCLPLHGRVKVARLGAGSGESIEVGGILPFAEFACPGSELKSALRTWFRTTSRYHDGCGRAR